MAKNKKKLGQWTPWDSELLLMVERLTGHKPILSREDKDCYEFQLDFGEYAGDAAYEEAVFRAIKGRAGERYVKQVDGSLEGIYYVTIKYSREVLPGLATRMDDAPDYSVGTEYIPEGSAVRAVWFSEEGLTDDEDVLRFVGGGEITEDDEGRVLTFDTGAGVFASARDGDYIVYDGGFLRVVPGDEFEAQFVPR